MDSERWQRIGEIFEAVSGLSGTALDEALARCCASDAALAHEVRSLLEADQDAEHWLAGLMVRARIPAPEAETRLNQPGRCIGRWRLLRLIGRGGMGVVYLAERADAQFEKQVALKMLPLGLVTPEAIARFQRERQILAMLEHPNIARLLDGGVSEDGTPYFVMECVTGVPLERFCRDNKLSLEARLDLFRQVCDAVSYAHRNLVVHRDLKPSNILVNTDGTPKLLDFGVAKLLDSAEPAAHTVRADRHPVSPAYAAPEVLRGEAVTTACDLYSLGVLLFELLAGEQPYPAEARSDPDALTRIAQQPPPLPSRRAAALGATWARALCGDLDIIVACCLCADPGQRYRSVEALKNDLDRYRAQLPISARPATTSYRTRLFVCRHRTGVVLAGAFVALLIAGFVSTFHYAVRATRQAQETARQRDRAQAVSDFLVRIFSAANPREHLGEMPNAGELLDRGVRDIERDHTLDPETRARLTQLMGELYLHLARYADSQRLLDAALEWFKRIKPADDPAIGVVLLDLAERDYYAGALDQATQHIDQALTIFRAQPSGDQAQLAQAMQIHGLVLQERGDYAAAERALLDALAIRRALYGEHHESVARTLDTLGFVREKQGDLDAAEQRYRAALATCREVLPANDPFTASVLNDLGRVYRYQLHYVKALDVHRQVLAIRTAVYGKRHPQTAISLHNIGFALYGLNRFDEAATALDQALDIYREKLGAEHWLTARAESVRAELCADTGRFADAERLFDHALTVAVKAYGETHLEVTRIVVGQSYLRLTQGRYVEAENLLRRAARSAEACCSSFKWLAKRINTRLAVSLAGQGRWDQSNALMSRNCDTSTPEQIVTGPLTARTQPCTYARTRMTRLAGFTPQATRP